MIFFFLLLVLVLIAQIAEFFIPALPWLYNAHIYIVPVIVFYGAMALPFPLMLALALYAGLLLVALVAFGGILRISIVLKWSAGSCQSVLIREAHTLYVSFSPQLFRLARGARVRAGRGEAVPASPPLHLPSIRVFHARSIG